MQLDDLENRFTFHPATKPETAAAHETVRGQCMALAGDLNDLLPEGREQSLAITNLEQVMFWANAAIAREKESP